MSAASMYREMFERLIEMQETMLENDKLFEQGAKVVKKTFDALVSVGFTEDQAIRIVAGQGTGVNAKSS